MDVGNIFVGAVSLSGAMTKAQMYIFFRPGANFMSKKLGVKIPPGGISPNFIKNFPLTFLLEDIFLLDLGEIYSLLGLMKLAPVLVRAVLQKTRVV